VTEEAESLRVEDINPYQWLSHGGSGYVERSPSGHGSRKTRVDTMKLSKIKTAVGIIRTVRNWPVWFSYFFGMSKGEGTVVYELNSGVKLKLPAKGPDAGIVSDVWVKKVYTPAGFSIEDGDTVFDIGAHVGVFSIFAAKAAKNVKVYSFEPFHENFKLLKENVSMNDATNIVAVNKAIADKSDRRELYISPDNQGGNSFYGGGQHTSKNLVPTISIAEFLAQNSINTIDFLKMDCEGAEYEIFFNCPANVFKKIRKISMEYHNLDDKRNSQTLANLFEKNGYSVQIGGATRIGMLYAHRLA
jgi:FkbM family methyltransferase